MKILCGIIGALAFLAALFVAVVAKSAMHEIVGACMLIVAMVSIGAAGVMGGQEKQLKVLSRLVGRVSLGDAQESRKVAASSDGYEALTGQVGEAFCLGCRSTDAKSKLLYHSASKGFYHAGCKPAKDTLG